MTTKNLTGYTTAIVMALAFTLIGISFAYASEVTGTLSSAATAAPQTGGSLGGTVSAADNGSGGGGSSSSGGNRNSSNAPSGAVLGASTSNVAAPTFPNAGFAPDEIK